MRMTCVFEPAAEGGYIAYVEEIPGAHTQGETLEEARDNLREAVALVLETNREIAEESLRRRQIEPIREPLAIGFE